MEILLTLILVVLVGIYIESRKSRILLLNTHKRVRQIWEHLTGYKELGHPED